MTLEDAMFAGQLAQAMTDLRDLQAWVAERDEHDLIGIECGENYSDSGSEGSADAVKLPRWLVQDCLRDVEARVATELARLGVTL